MYGVCGCVCVCVARIIGNIIESSFRSYSVQRAGLVIIARGEGGGAHRTTSCSMHAHAGSVSPSWHAVCGYSTAQYGTEQNKPTCDVWCVTCGV